MSEKMIHIRLANDQGMTVAEADKPLSVVQGVTIFIHAGVNYSFSKLEGNFLMSALFVECGRVEEF